MILLFLELSQIICIKLIKLKQHQIIQIIQYKLKNLSEIWI